MNEHKNTLSLHAIGKRAFGDGYRYWQFHNRAGNLSINEARAALNIHEAEIEKHRRHIQTLTEHIQELKAHKG